MARWLIILGVVLVVAGLLWPWLSKLGLGRLPGDIVVERENFRLYLPIATSMNLAMTISFAGTPQLIPVPPFMTDFFAETAPEQLEVSFIAVARTKRSTWLMKT